MSKKRNNKTNYNELNKIKILLIYIFFYQTTFSNTIDLLKQTALEVSIYLSLVLSHSSLSISSHPEHQFEATFTRSA